MQYVIGVPQLTKRPGGFRRTIRNTLISALALAVLMLAAGFMYVVVTGKDAAATTTSSTTSAQPSPLLSPTQPSPNAPESAAVQALSSPVRQDSDATISVKTNATSMCTLKLGYAGAQSTGALGVHGTDLYGDVEWTWHVAANAPIGAWPVTVTCVYHGRSAVVIGSMQISK